MLTERDNGSADSSFVFGDFCDRHTDEELLAIATGEPALGAQCADEAAGVVVRVPGPLQQFVDGSDELMVVGATVGDVLAEVARLHPEFGSTVTPDGAVAGAFLITRGGDDFRSLRGLNTRVTPGDAITLVMAMAGG